MARPEVHTQLVLLGVVEVHGLPRAVFGRVRIPDDAPVEGWEPVALEARSAEAIREKLREVRSAP